MLLVKGNRSPRKSKSSTSKKPPEQMVVFSFVTVHRCIFLYYFEVFLLGLRINFYIYLNKKKEQISSAKSYDTNKLKSKSRFFTGMFVAE